MGRHQSFGSMRGRFICALRRVAWAEDDRRSAAFTHITAPEMERTLELLWIQKVPQPDKVIG